MLASWTLNLLLAEMADGDAIYYMTTGLQLPVLLFCLAISLLTGLLFGLHPAWVAARQSVAGILKDDSGTAASSRGSNRARKLLVAMQVGVSALLLVQNGLFLKSLVNLLQVDLRMKTEEVLTFHISPRLNGYTPEQSRTLYERVETEMAALSGVSSVASSSIHFVSGSNWGNTLTVEGYPGGLEVNTNAKFARVGSGFLSKMGIPLIAGREFAKRDNMAAQKVAVVNERFVEYFFKNENPIGRKFAVGSGPRATPDIEIVRVAKDSSYSSLKQKPPRLYYVPWSQAENQPPMSFGCAAQSQP